MAFLRLNEARNWTEFTAALREFVVPSQNFVYADVDGHIGYYAPGRIPIRAQGDGSAPAEGWTGEMEWTGWIPFDELPHVYDPPSHFIVTANHRPVAARLSAFPRGGVSTTRSARSGLPTCFSSRDKLTPDDFRAIQADTISLHAQIAGAAAASLARTPKRRSDRVAVDLLRRWNFDARADSARTGDLPSVVPRARPLARRRRARSGAGGELRAALPFVHRFLINTLTAGDEPVVRRCDNRERETCDEAVTPALHAAVGTLQRELGGDPTAVAMGRRAPRGLPASRARHRRPRCGRCSAARCRTAATGAR